MSTKPILLVDDDADDEMLTKRALRKNKVANSIISARDGQEALELLFEGDEEMSPVLILLDLNLPRVSGKEVLEEVRTHESMKDVPIILLSSSYENETDFAEISPGQNGFLHKPLKHDKFSEMVAQLKVELEYKET